MQALRLLSSAFVQTNPSLKQQAVLQLLQHSVALGRTHSVAAQAVKTLQAYDDELFKGRTNTSSKLLLSLEGSALLDHHVIPCVAVQGQYMVIENKPSMWWVPLIIMQAVGAWLCKATPA